MRTVDDPRVHADRSMRGAFFRAGDKGQSLVETALVLPVLLMFLLGILLCAITFYNYLTLTRAVTASASDLQNGGTGNIGPALPSPYTDPCTLVTTKTAGYALGLNSANITYTIILNNTSVYPLETGVSTVPTTQGAFACTNALPLSSGTWATVIATYPCFFSIPTFQNGGSAGASSCNLRAISTVKII
jgi:Flp pilus assembly protein TadG